jgi:L,D-transpeptidase-like protein
MFRFASTAELCARFLRPALASSMLVAAIVNPLAAFESQSASEPATGQAKGRAVAIRANDWDRTKLGSLDPSVFNLALTAAGCAVQSGKVASPATLTVIDYSKPSTQKRMWVVDLRTHALLFEELVAHGQGSGNNLAMHFSNDAETHQSSLGLFETKDPYVGKNGYSLRLEGLDAGFNDRALERAIVMHGAPYVSEAVARAQGRLGRSWGCPAVRESVAHELIDAVKGSGLVFAYYPDPKWLATSQFLGNCAGNPGVGVTPVVAAG